MTKRAALLILVVVLSGYAVYYATFSKSALEDLESLIQKELPRGASKQQVYDFLESRGISSRAYNAGPDPYIGLAEKERQWRRYVRAWMPKRSHLIFSPSYTIHIYFYFDEDLTLDSYKLQKVDDVSSEFP